ncbi:MAG: hypothetical protein DMD56_01075 [Gemmatimonadetes bacterium]|nr:MAG: hypothetical protein DMD56_01075 [Gemmatimonadota bacterium]
MPSSPGSRRRNSTSRSSGRISCTVVTRSSARRPCVGRSSVARTGRSFPDPATPLVIGILGNDPFEGFLEQTIRGEQVRGRGFQVRRYHSLDEIKTCHILFISRPEGNRPEAILAGLRNSPILTVSDADGFAERGGMIRFVTDRNHIRLQINLDAAQAASLTISSKLLRVAEIATPRGP